MSLEKRILEKEICIICQEELEDKIEIMRCNHRYHKKCILKWTRRNNSCPLCRAKINNIEKMDDTSINYKKYIFASIFTLIIVVLMIGCFIGIHAILKNCNYDITQCKNESF